MWSRFLLQTFPIENLRLVQNQCIEMRGMLSCFLASSTLLFQVAKEISLLPDVLRDIAHKN